MSTHRIRCPWGDSHPLYVAYHDEEWGVPTHDDQKFFEMLVLEGAQAGLSWITILKKRENYRKAFSGFDPRRVARYDARRVGRLMDNAGIVRNRLKVESTVRNARAYLAIQKELGSFDAYVWRFVDGRPIRNHWTDLKQMPASTKLSLAMSKDLKQRGFSFVGPTVCYSFMQATGLVNDHLVDCFRHRAIRRLR